MPTILQMHGSALCWQRQSGIKFQPRDPATSVNKISMFKHHYLYWQWLRRDVAGRYRGSVLGLLWPILQPLTQIAVFTLIFYEFMQMRWPNTGSNGDAMDYGLNVFAGLAVFNFFAEVLARAPSAILSQHNLVTKVRFPLLLLPAVTVGSALVHIAVGSVSLILLAALFRHVSWVMLWLPVFLLPLILYGLALALLLASLGIYLRDIGQVMPALTNMLMFLTPIFYPATAVPVYLKPWFELNPIGWGAQALRSLLLEASLPSLNVLCLHAGASILLLLLGRYVFLRLEKGFADVL